MGARKEALELLVLRKGWASTREAARELVLRGEVYVNGIPRTDPSVRTEFDRVSRVAPGEGPCYVGRGGDKLAGALAFFSPTVQGLRLADLGASTGGFTDCLLQSGAASVLSVDVGKGLLDVRLRSDPRVTLLESVNVRHPGSWIPSEGVDGVVADLSFISLRQILPQIPLLLSRGGWLMALVKPQFEAAPEEIARGGIVVRETVRRRILRDIVRWIGESGGQVRGVMPSTVRGRKGNQEYFCYARWKDRL
ncbi:MAG: TlyA family RNA methyltransferase [Leptospirillia bacterium]